MRLWLVLIFDKENSVDRFKCVASLKLQLAFCLMISDNLAKYPMIILNG